MIRLAIINLTGGGASGGYIKYLNNVIPRFLANIEIESVLCAIPSGIEIQLNKIIQVVKIKPYNPYIIFPDKDLTISLNNFKPDIIFCPIERPFKYKNIPVVTMLQNMEPFTKNSPLNTNKIHLKLKVQKLIGQKAIKSTDGAICLSKFVKDYLINELDIPKYNTSLIYHGISSPNQSSKELKSLPIEFDHDYIFTAGSIRPARGLEDLINAMAILKENGFINKLLVAGDINNDSLKYVKYLKKIIRKKRLCDSVKFLGSIGEEKMSWYYANSELFVMTSRVESFGMIAGEAMAHGCLNISSTSPWLPEIFGNGATYYNPGDYNDLAEKIKNSLLLSEVQKSALRKKAIKRSQMFSWDVCAKKTFEFLSETIERHYNENR